MWYTFVSVIVVAVLSVSAVLVSIAFESDVHVVDSAAPLAGDAPSLINAYPQQGVDIDAVIARWEPSLVHATCRFEVPEITKTGLGLLYGNDAKTFGVLLLNSNVTLIDYQGRSYSFDSCYLQKGTLRYEILYDIQHVGMIEGSSAEDGLSWLYIPSIERRDIAATVDDLCVHRPVPGDPVVLLGVVRGETTASLSTVTGTLDDGRGFWLSDARPLHQHPSVAIDKKHNCYLGVISSAESQLLTFLPLSRLETTNP